LAACLLNHSGYNIMGKKSRGLLLIKLLSKEFEISNITDFVKDYSPFILVLIDFYSNSKYQYIWDGKKFSSLSIIEDQKIFLSTTIYTQKEIDFYNDSFMSLKYADLTPENIYNYHLSKSNLHSSVNQKTTSITQISNIDKTSMRYTDLMNREEHLLSL